MHILASMEPIEMLTADELAARMPETAKTDLLEWAASDEQLPAYLQSVLSSEFSPVELLNPGSKNRITDDQPFNEYFLLRYLDL